MVDGGRAMANRARAIAGVCHKVDEYDLTLAMTMIAAVVGISLALF